MLPEWYPTSGWIQHAPFAYWLVTTLRPRRYVELGSHFGYSFSAVCQAVAAYDLPTQCIAIDAWQGDEHAGFYGDEVHRIVQARLNSKYSRFATMKRMFFDQALGDFTDGSIDLLHSDGRHYYEDAKNDLEAWLPKVARAGIVMVHDTRVFDRGFGVHRLWAEIKDRSPSFEFTHGNGLGVLAIGEPPAMLADFRRGEGRNRARKHPSSLRAAWKLARARGSSRTSAVQEQIEDAGTAPGARYAL